MENVYDIKREENLNIILPSTYSLGDVCSKDIKIAVIIHLYYKDSIDEYVKYILRIPENIDIIFTISDEEIERILKECLSMRQKSYKFIKKENRGRDVSAFLVATRKLIMGYEYICFVHDKKGKVQYQDEIDTKEWIRGLWENTLASQDYINNIIYTFQHNDNIGLLVPPFPISTKRNIVDLNSWTKNYANAEKLVRLLNLKCDLNMEKPPITLGTVFWAKVTALKKLFNKEWEYEDFNEEPLEEDGTISHAIERIFAYVAQDAGFKTGWVCTQEYAAERMEYMNCVIGKIFSLLDKYFNVPSMQSLEEFDRCLSRYKNFIDQNSSVYVYGAGAVAKSLRKTFCLLDFAPKAYVVFCEKGNPTFLDDIPVIELSEIDFMDNPGIIIAVGKKYEREVQEQINILFGGVYENILIL